MNIYDTANKLAAELKQTDEYKAYKNSKQQIESNAEVKSKIDEFDKMRYEVQLDMMKTGNSDLEKQQQMQQKYAELVAIPEAKKFFDTETKFNILIADVNKIIGEAIRDVMQ